MATPSLRLFRRFEGLFSVYKPQGVHWKLVRDTIETNLLKGINDVPAQHLPRLVKFLPESSGENDGPRELTISAASVPALSEHPLVTGPEFQRLKVGVGHRLDAFSSGVLVLGVGHGNKVMDSFYKKRVTRDYTLEGEFGKATDSFSHTGRVVERSTYGHITRDKLEKILAMLQGVNQKALLTYSKVDMRSQKAYEMAVKGELGPDGKSPPILTSLRCIDFQPPHFTLEVQCLNETQKYLCKLVHEVGLELRSTAVCKAVRRTRDGPFTVEDALTRHHWTASDVRLAIQKYHSSKKRNKSSHTEVKATSTEAEPEDVHLASQQN